MKLFSIELLAGDTWIPCLCSSPDIPFPIPVVFLCFRDKMTENFDRYKKHNNTGNTQFRIVELVPVSS